MEQIETIIAESKYFKLICKQSEFDKAQDLSQTVDVQEFLFQLFGELLKPMKPINPVKVKEELGKLQRIPSATVYGPVKNKPDYTNLPFYE